MLRSQFSLKMIVNEVFIDGIAVGGMTTNVSGKLVLSVELNEGVRTEIRIAGR